MNQSAYALRENTGTSGVLETALAAANALADYGMTELSLRRKLPRELAVATPVRDVYLETWDALQAER